MSLIQLYPSQIEALRKMHNGCILAGGVGSGKSITSIAYFFMIHGGKVLKNQTIPMKNPRDLYIITTAKKRDSLDWDKELAIFAMSRDLDTNYYSNKIIVDSWNNIEKYKQITNAFFIFDEDKVTGYGKWAKTFIKIAKSNGWIVLSATPGDNYLDYMSIFIANGFFKNKTDFTNKHVIYDPHRDFPMVIGYRGSVRLDRLISKILIPMSDCRNTVRHYISINCDYDKSKYNSLMKTRWNLWKDEPMQNAAELCQCCRRAVNEDETRQVAVLEILEAKPRAIIFYNTNYELDILRNLGYQEGTILAEYNGQKHQPLPTGDRWVYLVHFNCCEAWNAITTDTIIFYSQNYSYKNYEQACGRIDRLNTLYHDLYYYNLISKAPIDRRIKAAREQKRIFNENRFIEW